MVYGIYCSVKAGYLWSHFTLPMQRTPKKSNTVIHGKSRCRNTTTVQAGHHCEPQFSKHIHNIQTLTRSNFYPFDAHCCHMGTAIKHPVPDLVKPSFVILNIRALRHSGLSIRVPDVKIYKRRLNQVWHRMLYSCTHMATVGVKGLYLCYSKRTVQQLTPVQYTVCAKVRMCLVHTATRQDTEL